MKVAASGSAPRRERLKEKGFKLGKIVRSLKGQPIGNILEGGEPKLTVRIIGRCDFHCPACSTFSSPGRKGVLSLNDFHEIVDILNHADFKGVLNISGGEPTLHPHLRQMIKCASDQLNVPKIVLFTNGDWIGRKGWHNRLGALMEGSNVLVRFSLDRQHAQGKAIALGKDPHGKEVAKIEAERLAKARNFTQACLEAGHRPGVDFDFAYKGSLKEARSYVSTLGDVPIFPIRFQKYPARRPKQMGFFAVDLDEKGHPSIYLTLGHLSRNLPLGGIEALSEALDENRKALRLSVFNERALQ